jgi:putative oxidoreductase
MEGDSAATFSPTRIRLMFRIAIGMTFVIHVFVYGEEYWTQHLMWAAVLMTLLTKGPDTFSLDHIVERTLRAKGIVP